LQTIHDERVDLRTWVGVLWTMLGAFMATLDIQVTTLHSAISRGGIAATQDEGSWISTSYLIGELITIPLTAWLARVIQRALVFAGKRCVISPVFLSLRFSAQFRRDDPLSRLFTGFTGGVMILDGVDRCAFGLYLRASKPAGTRAGLVFTATLGPAIGPSVAAG